MAARRKQGHSSGELLPASLPGHVSGAGRLSLPAELRRQVGLERDGAVRIELVDGVIRIRTMKDVKNHIRSLARESGSQTKQASPISSDGEQLNARVKRK